MLACVLCLYQVYEGMVYMDFDVKIMEKQSYGN